MIGRAARLLPILCAIGCRPAPPRPPVAVEASLAGDRDAGAGVNVAHRDVGRLEPRVGRAAGQERTRIRAIIDAVAVGVGPIVSLELVPPASTTASGAAAPAEGDRAEVEAGVHCGSLCGFGYRVRLVFRRGRWLCEAIVPTWAS